MCGGKAIYVYTCVQDEKIQMAKLVARRTTSLHERKGGRPNVCRACRKDVVFLQQNMAFVILNNVTYLANPNCK